MKFTQALYIVLIGCFASFMACDENELVIDGIAPTINAKFINNDSLATVNALITTINAEVAAIDTEVQRLEKLMTDGDPTDYSGEIAALKAEKTTLNKEKTELNAIKSDIKNGKVFIDKITGVGGTGERTYEDSLTNYGLPLNVSQSTSEFLITLAGNEYRLAFSYERDTLLTENEIRIEARNIKLLEHSLNLDSVTFPCDTLNCESYEATATVYF